MRLILLFEFDLSQESFDHIYPNIAGNQGLIYSEKFSVDGTQFGMRYLHEKFKPYLDEGVISSSRLITACEELMQKKSEITPYIGDAGIHSLQKIMDFLTRVKTSRNIMIILKKTF